MCLEILCRRSCLVLRISHVLQGDVRIGFGAETTGWISYLFQLSDKIKIRG